MGSMGVESCPSRPLRLAVSAAVVCAALGVAAVATAGSGPAASATRIAFATPSNSGTACDGQICTVDARGAAVKQLTTSALLAKADKVGCGLPADGGKGPCLAQEPTFSKNGTKIVFQAVGLNNFGELWVMNADGSHLTPLTATNAMVGVDHPTWSPDGATIAFSAQSTIDAPREIWTIRASGAGLRMLTKPSTRSFASQPAWSPNGRLIAFSSYEGTGGAGPSNPGGIYVMNADGTNIHRLPAADPGPEQDPAWSPDGKWLVFSQLSTNWDTDHIARIYKMSPDGSNARALTKGAWDGEPAVSPDGKKIGFYRTHGTGGHPHVYIVNADGTGLHQLLTMEANAPSWGIA
jgi:Tol biopolymer transport system component